MGLEIFDHYKCDGQIEMEDMILPQKRQGLKRLEKIRYPRTTEIPRNFFQCLNLQAITYRG